ncbi:MAG: RDD family protein [Myxococcota bacterium]|nr:RDD family protein [Myxococcota bacterium]
MLLDTTRTVETPEGVSLSLRVAGPTVRAVAWMLDQLIRAMMYGVFGFTISLMGQAGSGPLMVVIFLMEWFYPVLFEVTRRGQTPGKQVMGLAVVHDDGRPVGLEASVIRNLLRFADFLPLAYFFGIAAMVSSRDFKRLGDLAAQTVVVYIDRPDSPKPLTDAPPCPAPVALTLQEQRAVIDFAVRGPEWTNARAEELAALVHPTFTDTEALNATARWLLGRR